MQKRIKELDFLRGVAILLVMLRHSNLSFITTRIGWIGVDLFFVLSGFLVSGLLFSEYKEKGKIKPVYFLIRRGLKIYPLFYVVLALHILYYFYKGMALHWGNVIPEIFFFQNYTPGIIGISWSLAIEEHFYLIVCIVLFLFAKKNIINKGNIVRTGCVAVMLCCLLLRIIVWFGYPSFNPYIHFFPTHLRIDSLAFGVLLAWQYHFAFPKLHSFVRAKKFILLLILPFLFFPVFVWPVESVFILTGGFTFLYIGFGIVLSIALIFEHEIRGWLKKIYLAVPYNFISWIGVYSYSIYLIHMKAGPILSNLVNKKMHETLPDLFIVVLSIGFNILAGFILSKIIERPVLKLREKYFPKKLINPPIHNIK